LIVSKNRDILESCFKESYPFLGGQRSPFSFGVLEKQGKASSSNRYTQTSGGWLFHEIKSYILYKEKNVQLTYWKLADSGREVDFIVNDCEIAIESKGTDKVRTEHFMGLRELKKNHPSDSQFFSAAPRLWSTKPRKHQTKIKMERV
jgi:hypothetical protein